MGGTGGSARADPGPAVPVPARDRLGWRAGIAFALTVGVLLAAVPGLTARSGDQHATTVAGLAASGSAALVASLVALGWWFWRRRTDPMPLWRALFAAALLVWSAGQLMLAAEAATGRLAYPAAGDLVSALAAPVGIAALVSVRRTSSASWPGLRLVLDAMAVGLALAFAIRTALRSGAGAEIDDFGTIAFVVADTSIFALVLVACIRDVRCRLGAGLVGLACHLAADMLSLVAAADTPRACPALAAVLWCVGWPLVAVGIIRYRPRSVPDASPEQDRRESLVMHATSGISSVLILGTVLLNGVTPADQAGLLLFTGILAVMAVRDFVGDTVRTRLTTRLREHAYGDPLTGLANRRALTARIDEPADARPWFVLTLDLDGFTQVNDLLGPAAGDRLLVAVGEVVADQEPEGGLAARLGGDEFAVLGPGDLAEGARLGEALLAAVRGALDRQVPGLGTSASVGVGRLVRTGGPDGDAAPDAGEDGDRLAALVESAAALRAAKAAGGNRVSVYADDVAAQRERRLVLERRLRHAVATGAIVTWGQPVVHLDGELYGFEALARWTDDVLGAVPPDEFIAVAEQTGLVAALGEQLLATTLARASEAGVFEAGLTVAVNVSPIQLRVPGFADLLRHTLDRHRVPPGQVVVEITEAILVAEGDPALRTLDEIAALGVQLAIDDLGTGYAALGYLRRLPVHLIKVDRSLTRTLDEPRTLAIVEGIVQMAHRMGIRVVMEGIEDEWSAEACRAIGADIGQGWLFGRPSPWTEARAVIRTSPVPSQRRP